MADDDGGAPPPGGGGGVRIRKEYLWAGGIALAGGLVWMVWQRWHAKPTSTTTTVITGSVSSNTGISGSMLNAILKDWQEHPGTSSTSTGTGTKKKTTKTSTTGTKKTTKTTTPKKLPTLGKPGKKGVDGGPPVTGYKEVTVRSGQTLDEIAKEYGITPAQLASANTYVKGELPGNAKVGQTLGTGAGLKTGQVLRVPQYAKKG
jgi:LysM repeat protein